MYYWNRCPWKWTFSLFWESLKFEIPKLHFFLGVCKNKHLYLMASVGQWGWFTSGQCLWGIFLLFFSPLCAYVTFGWNLTPTLSTGIKLPLWGGGASSLAYKPAHSILLQSGLDINLLSTDLLECKANRIAHLWGNQKSWISSPSS